MAAFDDFMQAFSYNPETFDAEQFRAAIQSAHNEDTSAQAAIIAARDAELADRDQRIEKLGRDNWNLLMKQGPKVDEVAQTQESSGDAEEHKPKAIADMFKRVERR